MLKKYLLIILLIFELHVVNAQLNDEGIPFIKNFTTKDYNAHTQNYAITQDNRGVFYFANFSGVLEYDGNSWNLITTDNGYRVTSLKTDKSGKIFAGGLGEFGFLAPDEYGMLKYNKLNTNSFASDEELIEIDKLFFENQSFGEKSFLETKNILVDDNNTIFFVSEKGIVKFENQKLSVFYKTSSEIVSSQILDNLIYIFETGNDVSKFVENKQINIALNKNTEELFSLDFIVKINSDSLLVGSGKSGIFLLRNDTLLDFQCEADDYFLENEITCGVILNDNNLAVGTLRGGIILINSAGQIVKIIDKEAGLNDESVNFLYISNEQNLWAALYSGISEIQVPSSFSYFNSANGLIGEVIDIVKFENKIYAATKEGLYYLKNNNFYENYIINFSCIDLEIYNDKLLVATSKGIYSLKNDVAEKISDGFALSLYVPVNEQNTFYAGLIDGVYKFNFSGSWNKTQKITDLNYEIWKIGQDSDKNLWFQTSDNGIIKFNVTKETVVLYDTLKGLPSLYSNQLNFIENEIFVGTEKGIYKYNSENDFFEKSNIFTTDISFSKFLTTIYGKTNLERFFYETEWISDLRIDKFGNIWNNEGDKKSVSVFLKTQNNYLKYQTAFLPVKEFIAKQIFCDTITGNTWLGGDDGILRYDPYFPADYEVDFNTIIREVKLKNDSVVFNGTFFDENNLPQLSQNESFIQKINYKLNTISFTFASSTYNINDIVQYQYFLEGFEQNWSELASINKKEYTNLPEGQYTFYVRAVNVYGVTGSTAEFKFEILTPFYRTWWAISIYIIVLITSFVLLFRWRLKILKKEKENLEQIVKERTEEIENQKEELQSQSEELSMKNEELERIDLIVQAINSEITFESLLNSFLQKLMSMMRMDRAVALIYDKETETYKYKSSIGVDISLFENISLTLEEANQRYLKNSNEIFNGIYYQSLVKFGSLNASLDKVEIPKSILTILVEINNKIEGFLVISSIKKVNAFTETDFSLAKNLREHINSAFIKAQILEDLQNTLKFLKETQDELIRKEKLASVGQLTKGIVDRLINPMNYINNFSEITKELSKEISEIIVDDKNIKPKTTEEIFEVLGMMNSNLDKINNHGVSATRIVKGMEKLLKEKSNEFKEVDLSELVDNSINKAIAEFKAENKEFKVIVRKNIEPGFETIKVIVNEISDAFVYLLNNSCYAIHQKMIKNVDYEGNIEISVFHENGFQIIKIKDDGIGIVENELKHIFEPFYTTKPTAKGTGLGLYMVQDIIKIHKGEIKVNSKNNEFTEIVITLPK